MKLVLENHPIISYEDNDASMIVEVEGKLPSVIFARVQSWDLTGIHAELSNFLKGAKKLRITIETIE